MVITANILGLCAVAMFVLSYQFSSRRTLIILNATSRLFYIAQYILLGAYEGLVLDSVAFVISVSCGNRDSTVIKRYLPLVIVLCNVAIVTSGVLTYVSPLSLLPMLGVVFETQALWFRSEKMIRTVSLLGAPCWFIYNIFNQAYGSALGNVITVVSIGIAMIRYDILKKNQNTASKNTKTATRYGENPNLK